MAKRHVKKYLTLLIISEMQIRTTERHHLTPVGMAIAKKPKTKKSGCGSGGKGAPVLAQPLWRTGWRILKN